MDGPGSLVLVVEDAGAPAGADGAGAGTGVDADAGEGPRLAAYAVFRTVVGESELLRLGADPERRRRGLGRRLLTAGLDLLRREGVEVCHLEVRAGNAPAIALYRGLGFAEVGRRRAYYADGEDALLLSRSLQERSLEERSLA